MNINDSTEESRNQELIDLLKASPREGLSIRGFRRVRLTGPFEVGFVGDTGWGKNQITNLGVLNIINQLGTSLTGSKHSHSAVGTGGIPASGATTLPGETDKRVALTAASSGSTALQMTATFASAASFVTTTQNIDNIGIFGTSSGGTLLSGQTYASSSCATNQSINATYTWTFARA